MTWAAVALTVLALSAPAAGESSQIEVVAHVSHRSSVAFPPKGRGGDVSTARWVIHDRYGRAVGDMLFDCRWVTADLRLCVGQMSMPLGTIAVIGASRTRFIGQLAVVGGTGKYVGASGTLLFSATGTGRYVLSVNYDQ